MGRTLIGLGALLIAAGLILIALQRLGLHAGHLPGDFTVRGRRWTLFAPLGTCVLLSLLLSLALYAISRMRR